MRLAVRARLLDGALHPTDRGEIDAKLMPQRPARLAEIVKMSMRYICKGSSAFSPILKAAEGEVGASTVSASSAAQATAGTQAGSVGATAPSMPLAVGGGRMKRKIKWMCHPS